MPFYYAQFGTQNSSISTSPLIWILHSQGPKGLIYSLYFHLLSLKICVVPLLARACWQEICLDLEKEDWEEACASRLAASPAANNKLITSTIVYHALVWLHAMGCLPTSACICWEQILTIWCGCAQWLWFSPLYAGSAHTWGVSFGLIIWSVSDSSFLECFCMNPYFWFGNRWQLDGCSPLPPLTQWLRPVSEILPYVNVLYGHWGCPAKI